jgi:hypothetical protein
LSPHLEKVRLKAEQLTRDFSPEEWRCTADGKWCASRTFEHLLLTYTATTKGTLKAMKAGQPLCRDVKFRDRVAKFYVVQLGIFPKGEQAPRHTVPSAGLQGDPLRPFNDALVAMDATLTDAERRFGHKTRILEHPMLGPLTAEEWRRFHYVHAHHHFRRLASHRPARQSLPATVSS